MATTEFGAYQVPVILAPMTDQRYLQAPFRDPGNPDKFDSFNLKGIPTSMLEGSTIGGDSGSPVLPRPRTGSCKSAC